MENKPSELTFRFSQDSDSVFLKKWLNDPEVLHWFPMEGEKEIDDSVRIWVDYAKKEMGLTALWNGDPCGMAVIYIQNYRKLAHTCLFSIIVEKDHRGHGVGRCLIEGLIKLCKNTFHVENLHLEVYEENPAVHLYTKMGFTPFGIHRCFTREDGKCRAKIFMQKKLV